MELFDSWYEVLEVDESATPDELKSSFRRLCHQYHPDKVPDHLEKLKKDAEQRFKEIEEAFRILSDPVRRKEYDRELRNLRSQSSKSRAGTSPPKSDRGFETHLDFRSGEKAGDLVEAAALIDTHWEEAKQKLVDGDLAGWLGRNGHSVLAADIREINQEERDKDIALERVVQAFDLDLPAPTASLAPREFSFARLESGNKIERRLTLTNDGSRGTLYGSVSFPDFVSADVTSVLLRPGQSMVVPFTVDAGQLAARRRYTGVIQTRTNAASEKQASISVSVSYPIIQTAAKVAAFGTLGAIIGGCLRWIAGLNGMTSWSFEHYEYPAWADIARDTNADHYLMTLSVLGVASVGYLVSRCVRK